MTGDVEFTAPCPVGHAGARWRAALQTVVGEAADDFVGTQLPQYDVDCSRCAAAHDEPGRPGGGAACPVPRVP